MAANNYSAAFAAMIVHEGSKYTDIAADRGGATKYGVTQATLSSWLKRPATKAEVKALTLDDVKPIYKALYANAVRFDELPVGIDYLSFDWAVNSGPKRAVTNLQEVLGLSQDGYLGPATVDAAWEAFRRDPALLVDCYANERAKFFRSVIANNPSQKIFEKGWMRRVDEARTLAHRMAKQAPQTAVHPAAPAPATTSAPKPETSSAVTPATPAPDFWSWLASVFSKGK